MFNDSVHTQHCYLSLSTLTSKNISGTLFIVCLSLNMLFLPFSCILTSKCINHTYPVALYTLNTPSTPYCLFLTDKNVPFNFEHVLGPSKRRSYLCSYFQTSKYVRRYLVCCLFASKYVTSAVFCTLSCNCMSRTYLVAL